jgi:hypothetical protein
MGVLGEVLVAFFLVAVALLAGGAFLTRPLWLPFVQRLQIEARRRRAKALEEQETRHLRAAAEQEIEAYCDPRKREEPALSSAAESAPASGTPVGLMQPEEQPPVQEINRPSGDR